MVEGISNPFMGLWQAEFSNQAGFLFIAGLFILVHEGRRERK
jgi:hypothetical protein